MDRGGGRVAGFTVEPPLARTILDEELSSGRLGVAVCIQQPHANGNYEHQDHDDSDHRARADSMR